MKKGDKVTIRDGSYTRSVINGELVREHLACGVEENKQYKIIETGCSFPAKGNQARSILGMSSTFNNTVIQAIDSGKVVFIEERFLELVPPTHKVMVDIEQSGPATFGMVYEISDKLYKEIKRGS